MTTGAPPSEPVFLILLSLADAPRHGYAIMQEVESRTGGRVVLRTATVYTALRRLVDQGLVEEKEDGPEAKAQRRTYGLTKAGRKAVADETARLREMVNLAEDLASGLLRP